MLSTVLHVQHTTVTITLIQLTLKSVEYWPRYRDIKHKALERSLAIVEQRKSSRKDAPVSRAISSGQESIA